MQMSESRLGEVISKFQMPQDRYLIEQEGSFGRGEFFLGYQKSDDPPKVSTDEYLLAPWCRV